jgi:hypothetical protein
MLASSTDLVRRALVQGMPVQHGAVRTARKVCQCVQAGYLGPRRQSLGHIRRLIKRQEWQVCLWHKHGRNGPLQLPDTLGERA